MKLIKKSQAELVLKNENRDWWLRIAVFILFVGFLILYAETKGPMVLVVSSAFLITLFIIEIIAPRATITFDKDAKKMRVVYGGLRAFKSSEVHDFSKILQLIYYRREYSVTGYSAPGIIVTETPRSSRSTIIVRLLDHKISIADILTSISTNEADLTKKLSNFLNIPVTVKISRL